MTDIELDGLLINQDLWDRTLRNILLGPMAYIENNKAYYFFDGKFRRSPVLSESRTVFIGNKRAKIQLFLTLGRMDLIYRKNCYRYRLVDLADFSIEYGMLSYEHMLFDIDGQTDKSGMINKLRREWLNYQNKVYSILKSVHGRDRIRWGFHHSGLKTSFVNSQIKKWNATGESNPALDTYTYESTMEAVAGHL